MQPIDPKGSDNTSDSHYDWEARPRNPFFQLNSRDPDPGRVYAAYEVPEVDDRESPEPFSYDDSNRELWLLECVKADWVDQRLSADLVDWEAASSAAPLSVLSLQPSVLQAFLADAQPGEIHWFDITYSLSSQADGEGLLHSGIFSEGTPIRVVRATTRPQGVPVRWLAAERKTDAAKTRRLVQTTLDKVGSVAGVAVYDVGQGACQALVDERKLPRLYIDLGGGALQNTKTFPPAFTNVCFGMAKFIVLSHWDFDHWSSTHRFKDAKHAHWIAPPPKQTPIQQAFAVELKSDRRLHIWDSSWPSSLSSKQVRLERCTGKTANDSGIAVFARPGRRGAWTCLIPGDAGYHHIPLATSGKSLRYLSITLHGGRLHSALVPPAKAPATAVCSVGAGNSYRHPFIETYSAHIKAGWKQPMPTGAVGTRPAHVFMPWSGPAESFVGGCLFSGQCQIIPRTL